MSRDPYDIIVVGSGIAGLSAAVSAASEGARVLMLERAAPDEFGGNTRWTESYLRMKSEAEVSDDFEESFANNAGQNIDPNVLASLAEPYRDWPSFVKAHGMPDPELIGMFAEQAGPTLSWLKSFGIRFDALPMYLLTVSAPRIMPVGGGLAMIEALAAQARELGTTVLYRTTAQRLLQDEAGRICGVQVTDAEGVAQRLYASSVVLASGGFEGNPEMLTHYLGPRARFIRPVARGGYYNKGEGIRMALAIGAAPAGDFGSYHAEPVDPRSRQPEALVMNFPYGIMVNKRGQRFVDEAPGPVDNNYDPISRTIADQPDGMCWLIHDQSMEDIPNWRRSIRTDQPPVTADTLDQLAGKIGIPARNLAATVSAYNAACQPGTFNPLAVDHLATDGLDPPKSNWARPIAAPPFVAWPMISAVCFTFGGLKVDTSARVLDNDGKAIEGLYAAGETVGLYYQVYTGATSVLKGAVFGRIAGRHAASRRSGAS